ncbi:MAG: carboxypeptidase-like regulatory domain-containing protein, partial [Muribaculaceae bacterium]|nr:carboxypeptidase-like regulatory domain-containing protein [Muribaculaceae bacterium]
MEKFRYLLLTFLLVAIPALAAAQDRNMVRGTVIDTEDEPVIGASVQEIDATNRIHSMTVTDINGDFSLKVKNPSNKIKISYVGHTPQVLPIEPVMNVTLKDAST